jgi:7,8-dihydropterin-6-yl-methyl-4-(beta-D-ribofuranosyl)aminobenzene 5'-phosphate synthase
MKITILVENSVYRSGLSAEHGLSIYIETETSKVLFDTGQSDLIRKNAALVDIDIGSIDAIFLSNGHYDHTGGLMALGAEGTPVFGHPDIFKARFSKKTSDEVSAIGNPHRREELEASGF